MALKIDLKMYVTSIINFFYLGSCADNRTTPTASSYSPTTQSVSTTVTTTKYTPKRLPPTTKPWRPILNVTSEFIS